MKKTWVLLSLAVLISVGRKCEGYTNSKVLFCYYSQWAWYRKDSQADMFLGPGKMPGHLCTHFVYSSAIMVNNTVQPAVSTDFSGLLLFNNVKIKYPKVKTLMAVGSFFMTAHEDFAFEAMISSEETRKRFAQSAVFSARDAGFDGIDIDWTTIPLDDEALNKHDTENFNLLLQELKSTIAAEAGISGKEPLLLTAVVPSRRDVLDLRFDKAQLGKYLDYISIQTFDFHNGWEGFTGINAGLFPHPTDRTQSSVVTTIRPWLQSSVPPSKLLLGLPFYGRSFTLTNDIENKVGSAASGSGNERGLYRMLDGQLAFSQLCLMFKSTENGYTQKYDWSTLTPYAYSEEQWISYDDVDSIVYKLNWLKEKNLGGAMVWSVDKDDITGNACDDAPYPLLRVVYYCLLSNHNCTANGRPKTIDHPVFGVYESSSGASCPYSPAAVGIALIVIAIIFNALETLP